MSNYYSVQRSIANSDNGRLITSGLTGSVKAIAIFPFYLRKQGNINSWEFTATDSNGGTIPTGFRAIMFSCVQACLDYLENEYSLSNLDFSCLKHMVNGLDEVYKDCIPLSYTGKPEEYVLIAGSSVRDSESYPVPNCIQVSPYTTGDRPYQSEDGEVFWRAEDGCYYFSLIEFTANPNVESITSKLYYK